jgi:lipopolysaccharide export system protein LptC
MLVLAALTFYLDRAVNEEDTHPALRRHDPDYMVINFTTTSYDGNGFAQSSLSAEKMVHFPDDDTTELTAPRVVQSKPDQPKVTVREAGMGKASARLTTEYLQVVRDRSIARTDREVTIVEAGRSLAGRGMEYSNETRHFTLNFDVRGRFEAKAVP